MVLISLVCSKILGLAELRPSASSLLPLLHVHLVYSL